MLLFITGVRGQFAAEFVCLHILLRLHALMMMCGRLVPCTS